MTPMAIISAWLQSLLAAAYLVPRRIGVILCFRQTLLDPLLLSSLWARTAYMSHGGFDNLSINELYDRHGKPYEVSALDGKPSIPYAPPHIIYSMIWKMPANELVNPEILIPDYGTSFIVSKTPSPTLRTPALYAPPEEFFNDHIITAVDVWTLGVILHDAMGERPLFEPFAWDLDDVIAEMFNTWVMYHQLSAHYPPVFRRLHKRVWDMGRGETLETYEWDVPGGKFRALEGPTVKQLMMSDFMVKWAMPAWERQMKRKRSDAEEKR
ncbi:hypothetical protein ACJ72_02589 [Emergomyces africanus]|uniref:Protein kinase domain-containing protein n=1 Tax=Emergomyces africanus TaxID=1955775 RepID=A0A1B7P205_9EURO|nr:hypothetical protein ACJ72_02589 [Emergomyces africanus]